MRVVHWNDLSQFDALLVSNISSFSVVHLKHPTLLLQVIKMDEILVHQFLLIYKSSLLFSTFTVLSAILGPLECSRKL